MKWFERQNCFRNSPKDDTVFRTGWKTWHCLRNGLKAGTFQKRHCLWNGSKDGTVCGTVRKIDKFLERFERWNTSFWKNHLYINLACLLFVCLFVCLLYPINVKTAEPIGSKFFVGHLGTPGKVYEKSKFQIFVSIKIRSSLNFLKFWKSAKFFVKIRELFLFCFMMYTKRTCLQLI